jgi:hypothetical protein
MHAVIPQVGLIGTSRISAPARGHSAWRIDTAFEVRKRDRKEVLNRHPFGLFEAESSLNALVNVR